MLKTSIITGALVALVTGLAIAVQSTLTSRAGSMIGDIRTGIFTNLMGGIAAGAFLIVMVLHGGVNTLKIPWLVVGITASAGLFGVLIVSGISFSLQRAGIAAGLASVILGQLALSFLIDTLGIGGVEPIPLSLSRILGILVTALGVYLLLPRK
jgi:transporter family-2 protein